MKIKFADPRINEYSSGGFSVVNDGTPIEIASADLAKDLLEAKHFLDGEFVPIFERAEGQSAEPAEPVHVNEPADENEPADKNSVSDVENGEPERTAGRRGKR